MWKMQDFWLLISRLAQKLGLAHPKRVIVSSECPLANFTGEACIRVRSQAKYVSAVRALLDAVCTDAGMSAQDRDDLKLAVGEAVCNAMEHGSPSGQDDYVCVAYVINKSRVVVTVSDTGGGLRRKRPARLRDSLRERGYGLLLIKNLTSAVRIRSDRRGTTVTMEKQFPISA